MNAVDDGHNDYDVFSVVGVVIVVAVVEVVVVNGGKLIATFHHYNIHHSQFVERFYH